MSRASWIFGLSALEEASLTCWEASEGEREEAQVSFAQAAGVRLLDAEAFAEQMVERYNMNLVKEEVYFYASSQERKATYQRGISLVLRLFRKPVLGQEEESGNRVYDAAAFLCQRQGIPIAPFDTVRESCGRRFDLQAVARVSHFSAREIRLEEQWYRQDIGPVIVTTKERGVPVVCLPRGAGRYVAYDLTAKTKQRVTPAYAATLEDRGTMFYRPFPAKKLGLWDLVRFGFSQTYRRDWLATWAMALVGVLIGLLLPTAAQLLYDRLIPLGEYQPVFQMGAALLACVLGNLAFTLVKNFTAFRSTSSLRYAVQNAVYDRLFRLPESFLERYDSADLAQRAIGITILLEKLSDLYSGCLLSAVFSLSYFAAMARFSPGLTWAAAGMLLPVLLAMALLGLGKLRYTLATPIDQEVDEGCFCECMFLLADAFDFLNQILDASQDTEKAKELLRQMQEVLEDQLRQVQEEAGAAEQDNDASLEHRDSEPAEDAGPQELGDDELEDISGGGPSGRHSRRR